MMIRVALLTLQSSSPALGLGYLISWFKKYSEFRNDVEFSIVEAPKAVSTFIKPIEKICKELEEYDIVGISTITQDYSEILTISDHLKSKNIPVILGGHHISALPYKLPHSTVVGVLGEGEITFQQLLELFVKCGGFPEDKLIGIDGICFHGKEGQIVINKPRERIKDIDLIPFPARAYFTSKHFIPKIKWKNKVVGNIITSRGCPYNCVFCSTTKHWSNKIRFASAEYVFNEIMYLHKEYDVTVFQVDDDLGTVNRKRWREIKDLLRDNGMLGRIEFHAQCRANIIDEELCDLFRELNFTELEFGIESGTQRILDYLKNTVKKRCTVEQNWKALRISHEAGINVLAQLIVGSPDETIEEVKKTLDFTEIPGIRYQICLLTPLPGTTLWQYATRKGLVSEDMDWSRLSLELNEKTFPKKVYVCDTIPRDRLWSMIKPKLDEAVLKNDLKDVSLSFDTLFVGLKLLFRDPRRYSKLYYDKFKSLFNVYFLKYFHSR